MTFKQQIDAEFARLLSSARLSSWPRELVADAPSGRLTAQMTAVDRIGCTFDRFVFASDRLAGASIEALEKTAQALASKLSYLLEAISPVEIDKEGCVVQMRSSPPTQEDGQTSYYELVVRKGEIALCRFTRQTGQARQPAEIHVTREVFCRLAKDFSEAV
jgi:hypothetical protein